MNGSYRPNLLLQHAGEVVIDDYWRRTNARTAQHDAGAELLIYKHASDIFEDVEACPVTAACFPLKTRDKLAAYRPGNPRALVPASKTSPQTTLCLAAAHALVRLEDGTVVGDPMERATLDALQWELDPGKMDVVRSKHGGPVHSLAIKRRFQFSSALKRMSTLSHAGGRTLVAVKGAPETIRGMLAAVPDFYDDTFKWYTRRGARVLALGWREEQTMGNEKIHKMHRDEVERGLTFGGFLVFQCPLKEDAVETLKMLGDASHRCVMITGDNPLTAAHVAREVEIVDRDVLILNVKDSELAWRSVDEAKFIPVTAENALSDAELLRDYDVCVTGVALALLGPTPALVLHALVYARVSPSQKEGILAALNALGYVTLMAGDGTNDVDALKAAHVGVALLDGTMEDLKKIAEHQRIERVKGVYESQLKISQRFGAAQAGRPARPARGVPRACAHAGGGGEEYDPMEKFDLASITDRLAEMGDEEEVPKIKLGDASCAAPFTSKLSNASAIPVR